ncbi:DNA-3-methyladenine glycosylase [Streptomyces sp. YIM 98790]|uniref:DNA-3-methyladenine glycosylase n=1 Tax=Streptomyces sp. YIM 98790 TaxID=2689077 RepID=UPI00140968F6|nr:DNA-3-methyladenine glycosylase [Streptomyces sp. YIM 98790]
MNNPTSTPSGVPDRDSRLPRAFFDRPVLEVAPDLLGRILVRNTPLGPVGLRLTEVEAYAGEQDPGSHAYRGRTDRNAVMFGPPGHAYVYFTYGMWHCLNLVCGPPGRAGGVLLRAGEVVRGAELCRPRRPTARKDTDLAKGPARLATALDVDGTLNGTDVCGGDPDAALSIRHGVPVPAREVRNGPRTGVGGDGADHPWRFWIASDPTVSPYRPHRPRTRKDRLDVAAPGS